MKFNKKIETKKTVNLAGGEAYVESPELELISLLLTSFVEDKFYESKDSQLNRLKNLVVLIKDKKFVAKAAIYARNEFGMRSITHALAGELAYVAKGQSWGWVRNAIDKIVFRADDMLNILAYYGSNYSKPFPNQLKKGLAKAIERFDAYQFAKYKGSSSEVSMVDLFNICHPRPKTKEREALYKSIIDGTLKPADTWEVSKTQVGQEASKIEDEKEKEVFIKQGNKDVWRDKVLNGKLGYFALLRNIKNIIEQADEETKVKAIESLTDENLILKSKLFPFRFTKAIEEVSKVSNGRQFIQALNKALDISVSNVPKFNGKMLIAIDTSASMSSVHNIATLFGAVLYKANEGADVLTFDSNARYLSLNPDDTISSIASRMYFNGGSTDFDSIFESAKDKYDRIFILSDMQAWDSWHTPMTALNQYKNKFGVNPYIYSIDLAGYGSLQFHESNVFALAGFSEKIFDLVKLCEQDKNVLFDKINDIKL